MKKITEAEKERLLIKNLNDRPNSLATYGRAKMSSEQLKDVFDKQFILLVQKFNEACDELGLLGASHETILSEFQRVKDKINSFLDVEDEAFDQLSEILKLIENNNIAFETDETLSLVNGVLSVNTAEEPDPDNTLPITAAAVASTVGNIEIILKTI